MLFWLKTGKNGQKTIKLLFSKSAKWQNTYAIEFEHS